MSIDEKATMAALNRIVEHELASMVRYTQYSLMIFGHARIPIIS
jgi:bacterioferritin